jgi:hypothetical protein
MSLWKQKLIINIVDFFTKITKFTVIELTEWVTLTETILTIIIIITNNTSTIQLIKIT